MNTANPEVSQFLDNLGHPMRAEIERLRHIILSAADGLAEDMKWNGPNYSMNGKDRITMRVQPPGKVQLIFHRGAKKLAQPAERLVPSASKLFEWKENDRAVATFKKMTDVESGAAELGEFVGKWVEAAR